MMHHEEFPVKHQYSMISSPSFSRQALHFAFPLFSSKNFQTFPLPLSPFLLTLKKSNPLPPTSPAPAPPLLWREEVRTMHKLLIHKLICCQSLVIKCLYDKNIISAKVERGNQVARKLFWEPCFCLVRVWFCLWN